jgi:hypothetical protein
MRRTGLAAPTVRKSPRCIASSLLPTQKRTVMGRRNVGRYAVGAIRDAAKYWESRSAS